MNIPQEHINLLIQRIKSGDAIAYNRLVNNYYKQLCGYAFSLTKDHGHAEDIVQNIFVTIWVKRKKLNPQLSIKSYLYKSVYNNFIDQYRKNKPVIYLEKKYLEAIDQVIENDQENLESLIQLVNEEIDKLPAKCKRIFLLNKKEGLTHIEISEYLNISIKTVEGHITRAFKTLDEKLGTKLKPLLFLLFKSSPVSNG